MCGLSEGTKERVLLRPHIEAAVTVGNEWREGRYQSMDRRCDFNFLLYFLFMEIAYSSMRLIDSFVYRRFSLGLPRKIKIKASLNKSADKQGINSGHAFSYVSRRKRDQAACLFYLFFPECAALIAFLFMLTYSRTRERAKRPSRHSPRLSIYPVKIYCKPWAHERRSTWLLLSEKRECVRLIHSRFNMRLSLTAKINN